MVERYAHLLPEGHEAEIRAFRGELGPLAGPMANSAVGPLGRLADLVAALDPAELLTGEQIRAKLGNILHDVFVTPDQESAVSPAPDVN